MKINIYDTVSHVRHCSYCINQNRNQFECNNCISTNDYYCKPSRFIANDIELAKDYFTLLEEYTKILYKLGFEF